MSGLRPLRALLSVLAASIGFALVHAPTAARADFVVIVIGDLSALSNGTVGVLDFQFNPGNVSGYDPATATISDFTSNGLSLGAATPTGGGSGSLPSGIALNNSTSFNEVYQNFTINGANASFQFTLTLGGPAINSPSPAATVGTLFGLGVLDSDFLPLYGNADPVLQIDILPKISAPRITTVVNPPIRLATVPEPASLALLAIGLAAAWPVARAARGRLAA